MTSTVKAFSDQDLEEYCESLQEVYGDISTQFASEVALYGDAWPGAALQVESLRNDLNEAETEYTRRFPHPTPEEMASPDYQFNDILY